MIGVITMSEYINREKLLKRFNIDDMMNVNGTLISLRDAREVISDFPAADVAPVVRCEDCKYHKTLLKRDMCAKNAIMLDGNEVGLRATSADYFCACGARMDGAE